MKDFFELYDWYLKINEMGWIKSKRSGSGGIGYTFETLLGKEEDDFPIPDFKSIEIKTMRFRSKRNLHLFNLTPDGDYLFPIKRILDTLGYPSKWNQKYKVLMISVNGKKYSMIGWSKRVKLCVNHKNQRVELLAYNNYGEKIDVNISWSFESLETSLRLKLSNLAVIKADNKIIDDCEYFYYSDIKFYKLRSFDTFISLLEEGIITINFNIDVFKTGRRLGQVYDHGTTFCINMSNIDKLYQSIKLDVFKETQNEV